jgi:hypothetical protein
MGAAGKQGVCQATHCRVAVLRIRISGTHTRSSSGLSQEVSVVQCVSCATCLVGGGRAHRNVHHVGCSAGLERCC